MKKILLKIYIMFCLLMPFNVLAYSDYIYASGNNVGIRINSEGIIIVGFYKINGNLNKGVPVLEKGDRIIKIGDSIVNTINELKKAIEDNIMDNEVEVIYLRNNVENKSILNIALEDGVYKTGLYVKDSIIGLGTVTYIDPKTKIYGSLGHEVTESNTNQKVEVKEGTIYSSFVTSIDRSVNGSPGGKNAKINFDNIIGNIKTNTLSGIYGVYSGDFEDLTKYKVAKNEEVKLGKAYIMTVLDGNKVEKYEINITRIDRNNKTKNIYYEIVSENLINKAGGIVQGMSGSPIIQDDKIIGAVSHVVIDDVKKGYGIFITTMLKEGEK